MAGTNAQLPTLADLGRDLTRVSTPRRVFVLARPFAMIAMFALLAAAGWWIPAVVMLAAIFPVLVAVIHDLLHSSLGLSPRANRGWLTVMGVLALQSGHAIQATHLAHHRKFPAGDDPEAYVASMSLGRAVLEGPIYPARLWQWARIHQPTRRRRVNGEAFAHAVAGSTSVLIIPITPIPFVYFAAMFIACSLFPAVSVNLLHHADGDSPLTWTRTVRGTVLPLVTLGSGYHLEHHLYPRIPSPHYRRLARRLSPTLTSAGVDGYRLAARRSPRGR